MNLAPSEIESNFPPCGNINVTRARQYSNYEVTEPKFHVEIPIICIVIQQQQMIYGRFC